MKSETQTETTAAAQAVGRELITSALQRNPIIAVASAVVGSIIGLFRRPAAPSAGGGGEARTHGPRPRPPARRRQEYTDTVGVLGGHWTKAKTSPGKQPVGASLGTVRCSANVKLGGHSHG